MRHLIVGLCLLCCAATATVAQVSIGIGLPGVSIGINLPLYPELVRVPGYPVYYAPRLNSNFFFYDGMYWVYEGDNWYASSWYNGPWGLVDPRYVPVFVLRIPVRYYRVPPPYLRGWRPDAPPRWGDHWGSDWERQHSGWDRWNRNSAPAPAPLPVYQRRYSGDRYPQRIEQQQVLQGQNYRYQPRDPVVRQHYQEHVPQRAAVPPPRQVDTPAQHPNPQAPVGAGAHKAAPRPAGRQPDAPAAQDQRKQPQPAAEPRGQQRSGPPQRQQDVRTVPPRAQQPPQPAAAQRLEPARKPPGQAKESHGKGPAQDPHQGPERRGGPGQQHGGERGP
jgi:hypothetical protein